MLPFLTFSAEQFIFVQGAAAVFNSSSGVSRSFCNRCGSPLTYRNDRSPEEIDVMTCSLDDPEAFPPTYHVWIDHKLSWDKLADGLTAFRTTEAQETCDILRAPRDEP